MEREEDEGDNPITISGEIRGPSPESGYRLSGEVPEEMTDDTLV